MLLQNTDESSTDEYDTTSSMLHHDNHQLTEKEHEQVLKETVNVAKAFIVSSCIGYFGETMILTNWALYAKTMDNASKGWLTSLFLSIQILQVVGILLTSVFCDKYGFDKIAVITSTLLLISSIIQAISTNILLFACGILLRGLVIDDIEVLSLGFIGKLLPFNEAVLYTSYWYSYPTIFFSLGIIVGGFSSTLFTYRTTFIVASFIFFCRWLYILFAIRNKQHVLEQKQLSFMDYYRQQTDYNEDNNNESKQMNLDDYMTDYEKTRFPLCIEQMKQKDNNTVTGNNVSNDHGYESICSLFAFKSNYMNGQMHWFELLLNIIQFSIVSSFYFVTAQFVLEYSKLALNASFIESTIQYSIQDPFFIAACYIVSKYVSKYKLMKIYIFSVPFYFILIFTVIFAVNTNKKWKYLYFLWWILVGICTGLLNTTSEIAMLELQPKNDTGKINGLKTILRYTVGGLMAATISYFWEYNNHSLFWIIPGVSVVFALIFCLVALMLRQFLLYERNRLRIEY